MKIIAQNGSTFLVDRGDGKGTVVDLANKKAFPPKTSVATIVTRGYWDDPSPTDIEIASVLKLAEEVNA